MKISEESIKETNDADSFDGINPRQTTAVTFTVKCTCTGGEGGVGM